MALSRRMVPGFQFIREHVPLPRELGVRAAHVAPCRVGEAFGVRRHLAAFGDALARGSSPEIFRRKVGVHFAPSEALQYAKRLIATVGYEGLKIPAIECPSPPRGASSGDTAQRFRMRGKRGAHWTTQRCLAGRAPRPSDRNSFRAH